MYVQTSMMKPAIMMIASKQWNLDLKNLDRLSELSVCPMLYYSLEAKSPNTSQQFNHEQAAEDKTHNTQRILRLGQAISNAFALAAGLVTDVEAD